MNHNNPSDWHAGSLLSASFDALDEQRLLQQLVELRAGHKTTENAERIAEIESKLLQMRERPHRTADAAAAQEPYRTLPNALRSAGSLFSLSGSLYGEAMARQAGRGEGLRAPWSDEVRKEASQLQGGVQRSGFEQDLLAPAMISGNYGSAFTAIPQVGRAVNTSRVAGPSVMGAELFTDTAAREGLSEEGEGSLGSAALWGTGAGMVGGGAGVALGSLAREKSATENILRGSATLNDYTRLPDSAGYSRIATAYPREINLRSVHPDFRAAAESGEGMYADVPLTTQNASAKALGQMPELAASREVMQAVQDRVTAAPARINRDLGNMMSKGVISPEAMSRNLMAREDVISDMEQILTRTTDEGSLKYLDVEIARAFQDQDIEQLVRSHPAVAARISSVDSKIAANSTDIAGMALYGPTGNPSALVAMEASNALDDMYRLSPTPAIKGKRDFFRAQLINANPAFQGYFDQVDALRLIKDAQSAGREVFSSGTTLQDVKDTITRFGRDSDYQRLTRDGSEAFPQEWAAGAGSSGNLLEDVYKSSVREQIVKDLTGLDGGAAAKLQSMLDTNEGVTKLAWLSDSMPEEEAVKVLNAVVGREGVFDNTLNQLRNYSEQGADQVTGKDAWTKSADFISAMAAFVFTPRNTMSPRRVISAALQYVGVIPMTRGSNRALIDLATKKLPTDIDDLKSIVQEIKANRKEFLSRKGSMTGRVYNRSEDDDYAPPDQATPVTGPHSPIGGSPSGDQVPGAGMASDEYFSTTRGEGRREWGVKRGESGEISLSPSGGRSSSDVALGYSDEEIDAINRIYGRDMFIEDVVETPPNTVPMRQVASPEPTPPKTGIEEDVPGAPPGLATGMDDAEFINPRERAGSPVETTDAVDTNQNWSATGGRRVTNSTLQTPVQELKGEPLLDRIRTARARGEDTGPLYERYADYKYEVATNPNHKTRYKITGKWTDLDGKEHIWRAPTDGDFERLDSEIIDAVDKGDMAKEHRLKKQWASWKHARENLDVYIPLQDAHKQLAKTKPGTQEYKAIRSEILRLEVEHGATKAKYQAATAENRMSPWGYDSNTGNSMTNVEAGPAPPPAATGGRPVASEDMQAQAQTIIGDLDEAGQRRVKLAYEGRLATDKRSLDKIMKDMTPEEKKALEQLEDLAGSKPLNPDELARTQGDAATEAGEKFRSDAASEAAKLHRQVMNDRFGRLSKAQVKEKTQQLDDLTDQFDAAVRAGDSDMAESLQREMRIIKQDLNPIGVSEANPEAIQARMEAEEAKGASAVAGTTAVRRGVAKALDRTADQNTLMRGASDEQLDRILSASEDGIVRRVSPGDSDMQRAAGPEELGSAQTGYGSTLDEKIDTLSKSDWNIDARKIPTKYRKWDLLPNTDTQLQKRYAHLLDESGADLTDANVENIYQAIENPKLAPDLSEVEKDAYGFAVQNLDDVNTSVVPDKLPELTDAQGQAIGSHQSTDALYDRIAGRRTGGEVDERTTNMITMLDGERLPAEDVYDNFMTDLVDKNNPDTFVADQRLGMTMIVDHLDSAAPMPGSDFILSRINRAETTGQYANERFFGYGDLSQHDEAIGEFQAYGFGKLSQDPAGLEDLVAHITSPKKGMYARLKQAKEAGHADNVSKYELMVNEAETQYNTIIRNLTDAQRNSKKARDAMEVFENSKASSWYEAPRSGHGIEGGIHHRKLSK